MRKILGKVISCFTICMIMLSTFSITSFAATAAYISLSTSSKTIEVGDQITVTVRYDASEAIYSVSGSLSYNASVLQYVSGGSSNQSGSVKIVESPSGDSVVSYAITFKAVAEGNSYLAFSMYGVNSNLQKTTVASASVAITVNGVYYTYTISNGEATITDCDTAISGDIVIPSTLGGYPVTSIGNSAFSGCTGLTSITIPESVTSIGEYAFYGCYNLTNVYITDFAAWCNIDFEGYAANPMFYAEKLYLSNLEISGNFVIPETVVTIPHGTFKNSNALKSVTIPDSVRSIGDCAFYNCSSLTSIIIPDSVTSIGVSTFFNCSSLTNVTIGSGVTSIGKRAFSWCTGLITITIPDSVTNIGNYVFSYCQNLKTVILGRGITSICLIDYGDDEDGGVFSRCYNLESITIPDNALNIYWVRDYASENYKFKIITSKFSSAYYTAIENNIPVETTGYSTIGSFGDGIWKFNVDNGELTIDGNGYIPDTTTDYTAMPWYWYKRDITSIVIGEGIVYIGENVFSQTTNLKTVSLPESLNEIGAGAFSECPNLETINIPEAVTEIRPNTFYNCRKLKNIDLSHILGIGEYAFYRCSALENINLNSTFYVGKFAFNKNTALKTVELGENLSAINESAFENCTALEKVILPETVDYIDETAFDGCEKVVLEYITDLILGDISGDGKIDATDLVEMKKLLLLGGDNLASDINADGVINILDFIYLNKCITESQLIEKGVEYRYILQKGNEMLNKLFILFDKTEEYRAVVGVDYCGTSLENVNDENNFIIYQNEKYYVMGGNGVYMNYTINADDIFIYTDDHSGEIYLKYNENGNLVITSIKGEAADDFGFSVGFIFSPNSN